MPQPPATTGNQPAVAAYASALSRAEARGKDEIHLSSSGQLKVGNRHVAVRFLNQLRKLFGGRDRLQEKNAAEIQLFRNAVNKAAGAEDGERIFEEARASLSGRTVKALSPQLVRAALSRLNAHGNHAAVRGWTPHSNRFGALYRSTPAFHPNPGYFASEARTKQFLATAKNLSDVVSGGNVRRLSEQQNQAVMYAAMKTIPANRNMDIWKSPLMDQLKPFADEVNQFLDAAISEQSGRRSSGVVD